MATTSGGLVKRSTSYDPDVLAWLQRRGKALDRSVNWQVRQILRAQMDAEQTAAHQHAASAVPAETTGDAA